MPVLKQIDYTIVTVNDGTTYISQPDSLDYCEQNLNSSLASFHSNIDIESYVSLSQLNNLTNITCWIGLIDNNRIYDQSKNGWIWIDGTDYNSNVSNWNDGQPNNLNQKWYFFLFFF